MSAAWSCLRACLLDPAGVCTGCFRTLEEIARRTQMTDREKNSVVAAFAGRSTAR